jgi:hypothetical protein
MRREKDEKNNLHSGHVAGNARAVCRWRLSHADMTKIIYPPARSLPLLRAAREQNKSRVVVLRLPARHLIKRDLIKLINRRQSDEARERDLLRMIQLRRKVCDSRACGKTKQPPASERSPLPRVAKWGCMQFAVGTCACCIIQLETTLSTSIMCEASFACLIESLRNNLHVLAATVNYLGGPTEHAVPLKYTETYKSAHAV